MRPQCVHGVFGKKSFTSKVTGSILPFLLTFVVTIGLVVPAQSKVSIGNAWEAEYNSVLKHWINRRTGRKTRICGTIITFISEASVHPIVSPFLYENTVGRVNNS